MTLDLTLNIGDIIVAIVGIVTVICAVMIGHKQNAINGFLRSMQDVCELHIMIEQRMVIVDTNGTKQEMIIPCLGIRNIGSTVIYIVERDYNGKIYPMNNYVLAPISALPNIHYTVDLPFNSEDHISFSIMYEDTLKRRWSTTGYADLLNGKWEVTYSPSKQKRG